MVAPSDGGVGITTSLGMVIATLERPSKANALTPEMLVSLRDSIATLDPGCAGLVICGSAGMFSGGIDLTAARARDAGVPSVADRLSDLVAVIEASPVPIAAIIDGPCVGGAAELVVACDLRIGTSRARFRIPATSIGVVYRPAGYDLLLRRLGPATVRQLLLLGVEFDAVAAQAAGLLDMVADKDPQSCAADLCRRLHASPGTFDAQKRALRHATSAVRPDAQGLAEVARIRFEHGQRRQEEA